MLKCFLRNIKLVIKLIAITLVVESPLYVMYADVTYQLPEWVMISVLILTIIASFGTILTIIEWMVHGVNE